MNDTNSYMGALGAEPNPGGNRGRARSKQETGNSQPVVRRLFSPAVLAYLPSKAEALQYITGRARLGLEKLGGVLQAQHRDLEAAIRVLRSELASIETDLGRLPRFIPETEPSPHWPASWPMRLLALILLVLIGGLAVLGLINSAQFAVLTTNNWWTAVVFAAPMFAVPFTLKYALDVVPPKGKPFVYVSLGLIGAASIGAFVYTFASRFGVTAAIADPSDVQAILSSKEDNRLQLAAQMLTELSCGTALVLWFRKVMLGTLHYIVNPARQPLELAHSHKQGSVKELEQKAGEVQGDLAALPHRKEALVAEGLAVWYSSNEEAAQRAGLEEELAIST